MSVLPRFQNEHSQGWYLYLVSTRWFGMRIDLISGVFLATVAFSSIPLVGTLNAGLVGLGLTYTVSLAGMFQYCVRLSAEVENVVSRGFISFPSSLSHILCRYNNSKLIEPTLSFGFCDFCIIFTVEHIIIFAPKYASTQNTYSVKC